MKIKGFIMRENKKAELRIKELGKEYYIYRGLFPIYYIEMNDGLRGLFFQSENLDLPKMYLLGFSFEGLVYDEDKWSEIESFGKYKCQIQTIDIEQSTSDIKMKKFVF